jgi:aspartate-semialdehyde dehydrogenase
MHFSWLCCDSLQVNSDHLDMIKSQASFKKNGGYIVTNANCSTTGNVLASVSLLADTPFTGMVIALKPLLDRFGIRRVIAVTMQALSGAGYPGVSSLDAIDNVSDTALNRVLYHACMFLLHHFLSPFGRARFFCHLNRFT